MLERGGGGIGADDRDRVQPQPASLRLFGMRGDPGHRETPQAALLAVIDRLERMPEGLAAPRLDLDHDEFARSGDDEIELTVVNPPVAVEDDVTARLQVPRRPILARTPEHILRCHEGMVSRGAAPSERAARHAWTTADEHGLGRSLRRARERTRL